MKCGEKVFSGLICAEAVENSRWKCGILGRTGQGMQHHQSDILERVRERRGMCYLVAVEALVRFVQSGRRDGPYGLQWGGRRYEKLMLD